MTTTWILVANASKAHLYASPKAKLFNGNAKLDQIYEYSHPQSRQKSTDLVSDRAGRRMTLRAGSATYKESSNAREQEADMFARQLVDKLASEYLAHHFEDLIIAAPPQFHGMLNKHLSNNHLNSAISVNIEKDYTKSGTRELLDHLQDYL